MGSGKGKTRRAQSVSGALRSVRDNVKVGKMVLGGVYQVTHGELIDSHVETRFHPSEVELLDAYATRNNCGTREEALLLALRRQEVKVHGRLPLTKQERRAAERQGLPLRQGFLDKKSLDQTVILSDELSDEDCTLVKSYWERTGCQTAFGVPRHAFIAELIDEGVLPSTVNPPIGFTAEPIRVAAAATKSSLQPAGITQQDSTVAEKAILPILMDEGLSDYTVSWQTPVQKARRIVEALGLQPKGLTQQDATAVEKAILPTLMDEDLSDYAKSWMTPAQKARRIVEAAQLNS